ncbi:glycosyltransferase family 2 protein [Dechloromonas sp. A34]|uniref:glycosyltransferase family 2 protein n=1 Tax=Dechloromonas sp. A34 TaxID=447588 RepID=UPI0022498339|nr:glycosyltransferase [Dechloromonas sp. A34]
MNKAPLISVVLPVYNGEAHLSEALDSILAQSLRDFELIAIDDGSTDGSLAVLRDYERKDLRVRVIARGNKNLPNTLNEGIDLALGVWIARMDQDDIALPHRFERQLEWLLQTGADITGSWTQPFGTRDRRPVKHATTDEAIKVEMLFGSPFAHPSVMVKTDLVRCLRYDPDWDRAEDYDLWERAARAGWCMTNVPEVLLYYRQHPSQISSATRGRQVELTLQIQGRYCAYKGGEWSISDQAWAEILKMRQPGATSIQMDLVDGALQGMFAKLQGEALQVGLFYAYRLYLLVAYRRIGASRRWRALCRSVGVRVGTAQWFQLRLLELVGAKPGGRTFEWLKRVYLAIKY